jgi:hypothetical protein
MLIFSLARMRLKSLKDYCVLTTACSPTTLIASDGSLMSVFEVYGAKEIVGEKSLVILLMRLKGR